MTLKDDFAAKSPITFVYGADGRVCATQRRIKIDDDARFIGMILDEKVENVIDKDHVIDALKNGIHLNDYMKKTED